MNAICSIVVELPWETEAPFGILSMFLLQAEGGIRDYKVTGVQTCALPILSASTVDGPTARKNGGTELVTQTHQQRMGAVLLGWVDSGIRFNLWSTKEPKLDSSGHIDIDRKSTRLNSSHLAISHADFCLQQK